MIMMLVMVQQPIRDAVGVVGVIAYGIVRPGHNVTDAVLAQTNVTGRAPFVLHAGCGRSVTEIVHVMVAVVGLW